MLFSFEYFCFLSFTYSSRDNPKSLGIFRVASTLLLVISFMVCTLPPNPIRRKPAASTATARIRMLRDGEGEEIIGSGLLSMEP
jgi:hypothetical protein